MLKSALSIEIGNNDTVQAYSDKCNNVSVGLIDGQALIYREVYYRQCSWCGERNGHNRQTCDKFIQKQVYLTIESIVGQDDDKFLVTIRRPYTCVLSPVSMSYMNNGKCQSKVPGIPYRFALLLDAKQLSTYLIVKNTGPTFLLNYCHFQYGDIYACLIPSKYENEVDLSTYIADNGLWNPVLNNDSTIELEAGWLMWKELDPNDCGLFISKI